jgi:hypothetical protein
MQHLLRPTPSLRLCTTWVISGADHCPSLAPVCGCDACGGGGGFFGGSGGYGGGGCGGPQYIVIREVGQGYAAPSYAQPALAPAYSQAQPVVYAPPANYEAGQ